MNYIPKVHDLEQAYGVTWHELAGREPGLEELLWQARADGARCSNREDMEQVFATLRGALAELVGFRGRHRTCPVLGSVGAYQVAYARIHEAVFGLLRWPAAQGAVEATGKARLHGAPPEATSANGPAERFHRLFAM
jgi:hypothetical protein